MSYTSSVSKFGKKRGVYVADTMQYNRAELMRAQAMGEEIVINPKPQQTEAQQVKPLNPPTVTISNLNITTTTNEKEEKNENEKVLKKEYEPKEDVKIVQIRHRESWFKMSFAHCMEFYAFLDRFRIFGLFAEENGCLIITNYDDLIGEEAKYRTVKFNEFDKWTPFEIESKSKDFEKLHSTKNQIGANGKGVCTKNEKTIGIRHKFVWLQVTFRYFWEFEKFLKDANIYGLVDEHSMLIVRKWENLQTSDYRMFDPQNFDKYNDGTKEKNENNETSKASKGNTKKQKQTSSASWFGKSK